MGSNEPAKKWSFDTAFLGILALGSSAVIVFILGIFAVSLGVTLQAGATGAVRAIKMSATLTATRHPSDAPTTNS